MIGHGLLRNSQLLPLCGKGDDRISLYHELGLLMGLNQARQKIHDNFLLLHNSSVGDVSKDFGFNIADFKQLRLSDTHSIGEEVKKQVATYYGLVKS